MIGAGHLFLEVLVVVAVGLAGTALAGSPSLVTAFGVLALLLGLNGQH